MKRKKKAKLFLSEIFILMIIVVCVGLFSIINNKNENKITKQFNDNNSFSNEIGVDEIKVLDKQELEKPLVEDFIIEDKEFEIEFKKAKGDLDSLYANSYKPNLKQDKRLKTSIVYVDDSKIEYQTAQVTLNKLSSEKNNKINAILSCSTNKFNKKTGICDDWQITKLKPKNQDKNISFEVSHFSAYAGAYLEILNVQSNLTKGDIWETRFQTYQQADLIIEAVDSTKFPDDIEFMALYCGDRKLEADEYTFTNQTITVPNYFCDNEISKIQNQTITSGRHWLSFTFGWTKNIKSHNFACDSGTLDTTCYVTTWQGMANNDIITGTGNLVIQNGGTLEASSTDIFYIEMDGDITLEATTTTAINGNFHATSSSFIIDVDATINANEKGYSGSNGLGAGTDVTNSPGGAGGAGYSGNGGNGKSLAGGFAYGSLTQPNSLGSGGGKCAYHYAGGTGGGSIKLTITATTTINGAITTNGGGGGGGTYGGSGGGSGGSVWINTNVLEGSGSITANGGAGGDSSYDGGGGGGGRIAIVYTTDNSSVSKTAYGGWGYQYGGAGIIYTKSSAQTNGELFVDNNSHSGTITPLLSGSLEFDNNLDGLTNSGKLDINSGVTFSIDNASTTIIGSTETLTNYGTLDMSTTTNLIINGGLILKSGSTFNESLTDLRVNGILTLEGTTTLASLTTLIINGTLTNTGTLSATSLSSMTINGTLSLGETYSFSDSMDLVINSDGTLTHGSNTTAKTNYIDLTLNSLTINSGGTINANSKGYTGSNGPGAGTDVNAENTGGGGAGYGGNGGDGEVNHAGGSAYGSLIQPNDLGSGGGYAYNSSYTGGTGGGSIKLIITATTTINGTITINGGGGTSSSYGSGGGGSGGSVWINTDVLEGSGSITANGGAGGNNTYDGGGGAGGRIAIVYTESTYSGTNTANGGTGYEAGGVGTILSGTISGEIISSPYDTSDAVNILGDLTWTASTSASTTIRFQLRTSADGSAWTDWAGPDNGGAGLASTTYFIDSTGGQSIDDDFKDGSNDQWLQYKIDLIAENLLWNPIVYDVTLMYVVNATPEHEFAPTASMDSDGTINISYSVRDSDTTTGSVTPNEVTPSFEYSLNNGSNWTAITGGLSTNATTTKAVEEVNYTTHNLTWNPKSMADDEYTTTAMIRVTVDDGEGANNTVASSSIAFILDTTDTVINSFVVDSRSDADNVLSISATDDIMTDLKMKLSNNNDLSADGSNTDSGDWIDYVTTKDWNLTGDPETIYYQFKDKYGNVSNSNSITTVAISAMPTNTIYQDVSNTETSEWREFVAWGTVATPSLGFKRYNIYRSTDGTTYSLLATETDIAINYIIDSGLITTNTYYYKVTAEDNSNNISNYSSAISDVPDGQGGSDLTSPTITNVSSSSVTTQSAIITWDTDEASDSTVEYIIVTGGDFTDAHSQGVATMADTSAGLGQHSVTLTELTPNTTYYYQTKSVDPSSNSTTNKDGVDGYSFTTLDGPSISNVSASEIENTSAIVTWNTDINSDSIVTYSTNSDLSSPIIITGTPNSVTEHSVNILGLTTGNKYYYYVESGIATDDNGGDYYTFTTIQDTIAPTISNISVNTIADTYAVITWTTDEYSDSRVDYGTVTETYTNVASSTNMNISHSLKLSELTADTTYYHKITSTDANSNATSSIEYNFTTLEALSEESAVVAREQTAETAGETSASNGGGGVLIIDKTDKVAPKILNIKISDVRSNSVNVSWMTDEKANSFVEYGKDKNNYDNILGDYNFITEHSIKLKFLNPEDKYYYRLASQDNWGNHSISESQTFTTLSLVQELEQETKEELTFDEIEALAEEQKKEKQEEQKETAEGLFKIAANAVEKAMNMIKQSASKVSIGTLESTLTLQQSSIEELAKSIPAPLMSGEPRVITTAKTAAIAWRTDKEANSLIAISPENQYNKDNENPYQQVVGNPTAKVVEHAVTIYDLEPDSVYHFQLRNKGNIGPMAQSRDFIFRTEKEILEISNYTIQNISNEEATFKWVTNVEANSTIKYIPYRNNILSVDEAKTKDSKSITTIHEITINNFEAGVIYEVELISKDTNDNKANEKITAFSTAKDDMPPIIRQTQTASALSPGKNTKVQTIISWKTNEPSTTRVYYQKGIVNSDQKLSEITKLDTNYTKKHVVVITKFDPGIVYSFRAESIDSGGNISLSKVHAILTPRQKESVFQVIMNNIEDIFGWVGQMR